MKDTGTGVLAIPGQAGVWPGFVRLKDSVGEFWATGLLLQQGSGEIQDNPPGSETPSSPRATKGCESLRGCRKQREKAKAGYGEASPSPSLFDILEGAFAKKLLDVLSVVPSLPTQPGHWINNLPRIRGFGQKLSWVPWDNRELSK